MYKCPSCKTEVTLEKRFHVCNGIATIYRPTQTKPNKQKTVAGYMKRFGSKPRNVS